MLGNQDHCAGRDLYHATPAVTRDLWFFSGLIQRTTTFILLLWYRGGFEDRPIVINLFQRSGIMLKLTNCNDISLILLLVFSKSAGCHPHKLCPLTHIKGLLNGHINSPQSKFQTSNYLLPRRKLRFFSINII
jgi:hypothetical protein